MVADVLAVVLILVIGAAMVVLIQFKTALREFTASINFAREQNQQLGKEVKQFAEVILQVNLENETRTKLHSLLLSLTSHILKAKEGS